MRNAIRARARCNNDDMLIGFNTHDISRHYAAVYLSLGIVVVGGGRRWEWHVNDVVNKLNAL